VEMMINTDKMKTMRVRNDEVLIEGSRDEMME
jgi:hypothetical protein